MELMKLLAIPIANRTIPSRKKKNSAFIARHPHSIDHIALQIKQSLDSGNNDNEVFVDPGKHSGIDLNELLFEIDESESIVLLLTKETIEMPICLIELNYSIINSIPIVIIIIDDDIDGNDDSNDDNNDDIDIDEMIDKVNKNMKKEMKESGMELIKWCELNIDDIGMNMRKMISDAAQNNTIKRINMKNPDFAGIFMNIQEQN